MMDFLVFDSWEPLRKGKNLSEWSRLAHVAARLENKKSKDIMFTTSYPGQEGKKKYLGSVEGNLHFLLGYGNPGFHFAPYHWIIIDPNLTEEEALHLYKLKGHPSRIELWKKSSLDMKNEGDLCVGYPHPEAVNILDIDAILTNHKKELVTAKSGVGNYVGVPSKGLVYGKHNKHFYDWSMLKNSFFAAANPDFTEKMNSWEQPRSISKSLHLSENLKQVAVQYKDNKFLPFVYDLVKSKFPIPGSVITVRADTDENIYGLITNKSIEFYNKLGNSVSVELYGQSYKEIDLRKDGNVYSSALYNFATNCLNLDLDSLQQFTEVSKSTNEPFIVKSIPTIGFDDVDETKLTDFSKFVKIENGTFRLVLKDEV